MAPRGHFTYRFVHWRDRRGPLAGQRSPEVARTNSCNMIDCNSFYSFAWLIILLAANLLSYLIWLSLSIQIYVVQPSTASHVGISYRYVSMWNTAVRYRYQRPSTHVHMRYRYKIPAWAPEMIYVNKIPAQGQTRSVRFSGLRFQAFCFNDFCARTKLSLCFHENIFI